MTAPDHFASPSKQPLPIGSRPHMTPRRHRPFPPGWRLTTLREESIKFDVKVTRRGRFVTFRQAEIAMPLDPLANNLHRSPSAIPVEEGSEHALSTSFSNCLSFVGPPWMRTGRTFEFEGCRATSRRRTPSVWDRRRPIGSLCRCRRESRRPSPPDKGVRATTRPCGRGRRAPPRSRRRWPPRD